MKEKPALPLTKCFPRAALCLVAVIALSLVGRQQAAGQVLLNYDPGLSDHPDSESPGGPWTFASSFVVGQQNVNVTSINFILGSYNTPSSQFQCSAYIYSDSDGQPGSLIGSAQLTLDGISTPQFYDFTFGSELSLSAGATYWAGLGVQYPGSGPLYIGAAVDLKGFTDEGITPTLNFADTGWYPPNSPFTVTDDSQTLQYTIDGTVVPEPSSALLVVAGFAISVFLPTQRRKWRTICRKDGH